MMKIDCDNNFLIDTTGLALVMVWAQTKHFINILLSSSQKLYEVEIILFLLTL